MISIYACMQIYIYIYTCISLSLSLYIYIYTQVTHVYTYDMSQQHMDNGLVCNECVPVHLGAGLFMYAYACARMLTYAHVCARTRVS